MALNTVLPHIPDLVIDQIIRLLPTKDLIRMSLLSKQWKDVWKDILPSVPILDFDQRVEAVDHPHKSNRGNFRQQQQQHEKFNNILKKYLELYEKDEHKQFLEKFRLRMMYFSEDMGLVDRLLSSSFKRGVKELEISLKVSKSRWSEAHVYSYYCFSLSPTTLANAKSLTALKLEYMRIKEHDLQCDVSLPKSTTLLPSLKTMSLQNVHFDFLFYLIRECPSIEHLSLISCSFDYPDVVVFTTSLKSLEVKQCRARSLHVEDEAHTLESFTFDSTRRMEVIGLNETFNLKHVSIHSRFLERIFVHGCHSSVTAMINTPRLFHFDFYGCFMKSKFSMRAPEIRSAQIVLQEMWNNDEITNNWSWEHFSALGDFLTEFGRCREMYIYTRDFKALTFPEDCRREFSTSESLLSAAQITLTMPDPPTEERDIPNDFMDSWIWMAPSSRLQLVRSDRITRDFYIDY